MHLERLKDLSVYYWLTNLFADFTAVNVVDGFPMETLTIPTVSVEWARLASSPYELGNRKGDYIRSWYIDVFAINKSQRDDFTYRLVEALENPIPVYDYDEGFPPNVSPTQLGVLLPDDIEIKRIAIMPELVDKLYYRSQVLFIANYSEV